MRTLSTRDFFYLIYSFIYLVKWSEIGIYIYNQYVNSDHSAFVMWAIAQIMWAAALGLQIITTSRVCGQNTEIRNANVDGKYKAGTSREGSTKGSGEFRHGTIQTPHYTSHRTAAAIYRINA
jgi:hypothetical protein